VDAGRSASTFSSSSRHTARADSGSRAHFAARGSYAVDPIPDDAVAIGLQKNEGWSDLCGGAPGARSVACMASGAGD